MQLFAISFSVCLLSFFVSPFNSSGIVIVARRLVCASSAARVSAGRPKDCRRALKFRAKAPVMTIRNTAIEISPAVRKTALLMPDAMPACRSSRAPITVVVNGATLAAIPRHHHHRREKAGPVPRLLRLTEARLPSCPYYSEGVLLGAQTLRPARSG